ncbi:MAG TPA: hypothetical protein VEY70_08805 [Metabacillus sp.]|nr:hypothetical protein [Metabacillus sp.]
MDAINPMFLKPEKAKKNTLKQPIKARKKPITKAEGRKVRCDKKYPVKIMLTPEQRKTIRILAHRRGICPTHYCTELLQRGLLRDYDYPECSYPSSSKLCYPAKLEQEYRDLLFRYTFKWDCSLKKAAHRVFMGVLSLELEGGNLDELSSKRV